MLELLEVIRSRRRVETPPGAQAQVDWAHFPGVILGEEAVALLASIAAKLESSASGVGRARSLSSSHGRQNRAGSFAWITSSAPPAPSRALV